MKIIFGTGKPRFLLMLLMAGTLLSCHKLPPIPGGEGPKTIFETIASDKRFVYLTAAVVRADLVETLNDRKANLTLFAPQNQAFEQIGIKSQQDLEAIPKDALKNLLLYHVLGSEVKSSAIPQAANTEVITVAGKPVYVTKTADKKVFVNGVSVIQKDLDCKNGVIHVLDKVLSPAVGNIVQTAVGNPNLSYLVAAVLRASQGSVNVANVLSSAGPFTVFAPTNQAFINAGFATTAAIEAADPNTLIPILTYHVIGARVFSSDLVNNSTPATLNGATVTILLNGGAKVKGNANSTPSKIVAVNVLATNGVVHVIDQVLMP